ncbi:MAG: ABC transporter substrate-binding protein [Actinomycetes bacterium]
MTRPVGTTSSSRTASRRDFLRLATWGAGAAALVPSMSACLMESEGSASGGGAVRFAFSPDPVWDYLKQEGVISRFQSERGLTIQTSSTWDEFAYFAGGHGDIVSTATYELPLIEKQTKTKTVTFGKYNLLRITPIARADKPYRTLADIPKGSKIAVPSAVSSTLVWGMFAKELHGLDFRTGGGDYELVVEDHFVMAEHVQRGEVEAALVIPEAAIGGLRTHDLKVLYGNKMPYEIYEGVCICRHHGVMGNLFTATEEWFDSHRDQAAQFLALWETGINLWRKNQAEIIRTFPQHFAVEKEADVEAMTRYIEENDWFVDSVYLDDAWIERETGLYDSMKSNGFMDEDAPVPRFEVVKPPEGS